MQLYDYFRSSASYRVRIALALKGLDCELVPVHLLRNEQLKAPFSAMSAAGLVPLLKDGDELLTQSLAIIEYLDEVHPQPPLLPPGPAARARVRALALAIAGEIHPLDNLRVLQYLKGTLGVADAQKDAWYKYWIDIGFEALERQLARDPATGTFCHGESPTLADLCLVPQMANARRMAIDVAAYPTLVRIDAAARALPAFAAAAPEVQEDGES